MGASHEYLTLDVESWVEDEGLEEFHILPDEDIIIHNESYLCPCQPKKFTSIYSGEIWIHKKLFKELN